jgi:hypothetical protein
MRYILILLLLVGTAYGQSSPTSSKTRFVNGLYMGTKLDTYFNTADSNAIYWRSDSVVMAKYKGTARALAFDVAGGYVPYTGATQNVTIGNFRVSARTLLGDSIMARGSGGVSVYANSGTQVALFGAGGGSGTTFYGGINGTTGNFSGDLVVNGATIGRRTARNIVFGNEALLANTSGVTNTAIGDSTLRSNTSGEGNNAIGWKAMEFNTTGVLNTAIGSFALNFNTTGRGNVSVGSQSNQFNTTGDANVVLGDQSMIYNISGSRNIAIGQFSGSAPSLATNGMLNTTPSKSIYIGSFIRPLLNNQTNQIVIGDSAIGNGSNTVTIGNSSVTDNYFSGKVRGANFTVTATADSSTIFNYPGSFSTLYRENSVYPNNFGFNLVGGGVANSFFNFAQEGSFWQAQYFGDANDTSNIWGISSRASSDTGWFPRIVVGQNGNIGVGTNSPQFMFDVRGASRFSDLITGTTQSLTAGTSSSAELTPLTLVNSGENGSNILFNNAFGALGNIAITKVGGGGSADEGIFKLSLATNSANSEVATIDNLGNTKILGVYNATVGGTNRDVFVDNTGLIGYVSSFRASKKNIVPLSKTDWLHKLNPVTFNYRIKDVKGNYTDSAYKEKEYGLVAEEVETVNPEMVFYDVDSTGKHLRGVHYSKLIIPLLKEIQDQKKKLDLQQTAIEALIKRIEILEKR